MNEHGLLVHTAHYEAYGMVLTEALASGLPVMSTDSGALDGVESCAITRSSSGKAESGPVLRGCSPITRGSFGPTMQHPPSAGFSWSGEARAPAAPWLRAKCDAWSP